MAANYGVRAVARHEAIALAPRVFGPLMPQPCDPASSERPLLARWPREQIQVPALASMPGGASRCLADLAAMPTFLSPFKWRLIARLSNAYELHDIDVLDATLRAPRRGGRGAMARHDPVPGSMDADGQGRGRGTAGADVSRVFALPGGPMGPRSADRGGRPSNGPTCDSPAA